jgi:type III restriction enzyme
MLEAILKEKIVDTNFDIDKKFSSDIELFDYQIDALENTIKFLNLAFENQEFNKEKIYNLYKAKNIDETNLLLNDLEIGDDYLSRLLIGEKKNIIEFKELVNRCSFWMATGSGKSLVMIKLVEILYKLMQDRIPKNNILILAPTDDILNQLQNHIKIYNSYHTSLPIEFRNLRDFDGKIAEEKNKIVVYFYRSNNIVDSDTKEKELNYQEFFNNGKWYLILDEAHKGESSKNLSKRKALFSLIAKNGVIFNFSATFSDELDKVTTIFDFKLDKFLQAGYGKKIMLLDSSVSVKNENQLNSIAKSLILLAQIRKDYEKIKSKNVYHSPLMMTIANKVNTENADLKIFFEKLALISEGKFDFERLKNELNDEIKKEYKFNLGKLDRDIDISKEEFFEFVFHSKTPSKLEYGYSKNKDELIFKSKNSEKYFMLIRAGDIVKWGDSFLNGYDNLEVIDSNVFTDLENRGDISILLGSRMFIEGWDTNRVNIINFVELGKSDAEKLILQAIGRGVRIEPIKNKRKRILELSESDKKSFDYEEVVKFKDFIESLFIFPSKKEYIEKILSGLEKVSSKNECKNFRWYDENIEVNEDFVCVPVFEESNKLNSKPFYLNRDSQKELKKYIEKFDDATFILKHNIKTRTLKMIKQENFKGASRKIKTEKLIDVLDNFWNEKIEEFAGLKLLDDEIIHYQKMCAVLNDEEIKELEDDLKKLKELKKCPDSKEEVKKYQEALEVNKKLGIDTLPIENILKNLKASKFIPDLIECKIIKEHFYIPILYNDKKNLFSHIIKEKSEIEFLKALENYLQKENNKLKNYDKWMFSKIEERVDNIKIVYFDSKEAHYRYFYPDFIFWFKKGDKKYIIFIDPKGSEHTKNASDKVRGFLEMKEQIKDIELRLFFYNDDEPDSEFKEYWCSDFDRIFD